MSTCFGCGLSASLSSSSDVVPGGTVKAFAGTNIGLYVGKSALGASNIGRGRGIGSGMIGPGRFSVGGIKSLANLLEGQD